MPSLFDSHDEFKEWFSKDIESHAEGKSAALDKDQLSRLHLILKPFMLRRVKKDVEHEMAAKIEVNTLITAWRNTLLITLFVNRLTCSVN